MARGNAKTPEIRKTYKGKKLSLFYEKVRLRRLDLSLDQTDLANRTGLKQSQISSIEGGRFPNDPDRIVALARALETTPDYLFGFGEEGRESSVGTVQNENAPAEAGALSSDEEIIEVSAVLADFVCELFRMQTDAMKGSISSAEYREAVLALVEALQELRRNYDESYQDAGA